MSSLVYPSKVRAPRTAGTAIERARLALVPTRTVRAPRAPFAVLVFLLLGAGVVGLLMFNTHMQQASFYATSLQQRADALAAKRQALEMELQGLRDPQHLAVEGRRLGMVVPPNPAFLRLSDGRIIGIPLKATVEDGIRVNAPPAIKPPPLRPPPLYVKGTPTTTTTTTGQTQTGHGPASPGTGTTPGRKNPPSSGQGAPR